jgi:hypothetical protein
VAYTTTRNLLEDSQDFERSTWSLASATIGNGVAQAPDGTITADDATATGANATVRNATTTLAVSYTFSVWLKRKTGTGDIDISVDGTTWVTQSVTSAWQRFTVTQTGVAGTSNPGVRIVDSGDAVYLWGAQLEPGTTATDYVRTVDTVGKAYRWYEPTEGTVLADFVPHPDYPQTGKVLTVANINDNSFSNVIRLASSTASATMQFDTVSGGPLSRSTAGSHVAGVSNKISGAYKVQSQAASINGGSVGISSPSAIAGGLFQMMIGRDHLVATQSNGHIRRLTYWPTRQPDATLQVITQ